MLSCLLHFSAVLTRGCATRSNCSVNNDGLKLLPLLKQCYHMHSFCLITNIYNLLFKSEFCSNFEEIGCHLLFCDHKSTFIQLQQRFFTKKYLSTMYILQSNLAIRNFLVALKLFPNAKSSLSLWSKWQIGHGKWFLNTNLFLIKPFLIAKFDCTS